MGVFLSSFLPQFFRPAGLAVILLLAALFLIKSKPKAAAWLAAIVFILAALLGNNYFASFLTRSMEWRYMPPEKNMKADAILLVAGGARAAVTPRQFVEANEAYDRILYSAQLFKQGRAPVIIIAGSRWAAELNKEALVSLGIPENSIIQNAGSDSLSEAAILLLKLFAEKAYTEVFLVTSAASMDRTLFEFSQLDVSLVPAPTDYLVTQATWENLLKKDPKVILANLMPTAQSFQQSSMILEEYVCLMFARLRSLF